MKEKTRQGQEWKAKKLRSYCNTLGKKCLWFGAGGEQSRNIFGGKTNRTCLLTGMGDGVSGERYQE